MQTIAITQGDPAGIGPEIVAKAFRDAPDDLRGCFAVGDLVYSDPVLRATSDRDLLLPHADLPAALSFLQISGFQLPPPTMHMFCMRYRRF